MSTLIVYINDYNNNNYLRQRVIIPFSGYLSDKLLNKIFSADIQRFIM